MLPNILKTHDRALLATIYDDSPNENQTLITSSKQVESTIPNSQDGEGHSEPKPSGWDGKPVQSFLIIRYLIHQEIYYDVFHYTLRNMAR